MRRPPRRSPAKPTISPLDAGICLLGLEILHKIGLGYDVSPDDVLRFVEGVELPDPPAVFFQTLRHKHLALSYLVDGMVAQHGMPEGMDPI